MPLHNIQTNSHPGIQSSLAVLSKIPACQSPSLQNALLPNTHDDAVVLFLCALLIAHQTYLFQSSRFPVRRSMDILVRRQLPILRFVSLQLSQLTRDILQHIVHRRPQLIKICDVSLADCQMSRHESSYTRLFPVSLYLAARLPI